MDESEAIERAQKGDKEAFRYLVEIYAGLAGRTALVLTNSPNDAEDAVQDAWVDVWRALPRFQVERSFRPWLLTIVANRCYKKSRRQRILTTPYTSEMAETMGETPLWAGWGRDYDTELHEALGKLDGEQRRLLALRFYTDLKLEEIAEVMGVALGTVKSRLHRTMAILREELQAGELVHGRED